MNHSPLSDGKRARQVSCLKRPLRAVTVAATLTWLAPATLAQDADIVGPLTENVRCFEANAREDLGFNIKQLGSAIADALGAALDQVANDAARCAPLREAAKELAATYVVVPELTPEEQSSAFARERVAQTLAEADRHAASLKFEVGPPPRNMTKGRGAGSLSGS